MYSDFEGRTEQEAIDKAVEALGIERSQFDVEIIENTKKSFFKKSRFYTTDVDLESQLVGSGSQANV